MPPAAAIRLAVMHSLEALSAVVILDCMCMVCMVETSSDGRERVYVMFVCQVRVVGFHCCSILQHSSLEGVI